MVINSARALIAAVWGITDTDDQPTFMEKTLLLQENTQLIKGTKVKDLVNGY
jgi:hypothetical protein